MSLFVVAVFGLALAADPAVRLICCGGPEVFVIASDKDRPAPADRLWRWTAADSPEIPAEHRAKFRTTDECKPVGDCVLITASSGGVALVRRSDKRCTYFTVAKNAHSACLLPGRRVAIASSFGGDELLVCSLDKSGVDAPPLARTPLGGAHGALWDKARRRLWALGDKELLLVELRGDAGSTEIVIEKRRQLPTGGGHDLSFARDPRFLIITTVPRVYRFDTESGGFAPMPGLAELEHVKSVDEHPRTGAIVYHQGAGKQWWSDAVRFLDPARTITVPDERLYKARWDVDRGLPD